MSSSKKLKLENTEKKVKKLRQIGWRDCMEEDGMLGNNRWRATRPPKGTNRVGRKKQKVSGRNGPLLPTLVFY